MATNQLLGPGTYSNLNQTTAPWAPPISNFITITLNQVNTPGAGQTANLSGTFQSSQDGATWKDVGDFSADYSFTDVTTFNKNGVHPVPPSSVFGTAYAPHLRIHFVLTGTASVQSVVLTTV